MDSLGDVFSNDYVRVGLPVLMGVAAASSPAGARGAGAMLSSLGALDAISSGKERREELKERTNLQRLTLAQRQRELDTPKYEYRDGEWYALRPGQEPELTGGGDALTMVSREVRQRLGDVITGKAPLPTAAPAPQATGLPGTLDPDLERQIAAAERDVQAAVPGAVVRREGPATPTTVEPGTSMERLNALVRTPDGRAMIYLSRNPQMIKYMESMVKDERELDMAKKRAEIEYDYRMKYYNETFPRELQKSREQQSAGVNIATQRQAALRSEEEQARLQMSAREAADAGLLKDISRYVDTTTGEKPNVGQPYASWKQQETDRRIVKLEDDIDYKDYAKYRSMIPLVKRIRDAIEVVYGPGGIFESLTPEQRGKATLQGIIGRWGQTNPALVRAANRLDADVTLLSSKVGGGVGTQTEQDIYRSLQGLPKLTNVPDTQEVAYNAINDLLGTVNMAFGATLGDFDFQHPKLPPLVPRKADAPPNKVREDLLQQFQKTP